jgi:predicted Zn-dependent protease
LRLQLRLVRRRLAPAACALLLAVAASACGGSAQDRLREARDALADGAWDDALAAADAGLPAATDPRTAWGLGLVKLEAHARAGHGDEAIAQLDALVALHPEAVPATQYGATADQLKAAGNGPAAIQVLDLGNQRHPGDPLIARLLDASQSAGARPDELEMLRSLGYVE